MASCGVSVNISNLQSDITSKISILVDLSGYVGTPAGLVALQGLLAGGLSSITGQLSSLIPDIPFASELTSLRDQIGEYAQLPNQLAEGAVSQLEGILGDYAGITDISGFANINLNDLANSAFSIGGSFDPCALASGIPNIVKDASGALSALPSIQPNLGSTEVAEALGVSQAKQFFQSDTGLSDNVFDISSLDISTIADTFQSNVSGSISAMGDSLKKLPSGETIFQSAEESLLEQIQFASFLEEG